jgi:hypothetical protein
MTPFDIVKAINTKEDIDVFSDEDYSPWVINKAFSNTRDTVFFANEMNRFLGIPKIAQYQFYFHGVSKKKRFGKWNKSQDDEATIKLVQEAFGYSYHRAKDTVPILSVEQLTKIKKELEKGGKK